MSFSKTTPPFRKGLTTTLFVFLALVVSRPALAVDIQTVTSDKGIKALLVENYTVPLIAVSFSVKGGSSQDAEGKEGTAHLMTTLLDEGAGDMNSQQFQTRLDDVGVTYSFSAGLDSFSGRFTMLKSNSDEAFKLIELMVNQPRFDADPVERMKAALTDNLKRAQTNAGSLANRALREAVFKNHPYGRPQKGDLKSVANIGQDDLKNYHSRTFARENLVVGIVGAISPEELKPFLDQLFGKLPLKSKLKEVPEAKIKTGETIHVDLPVPQTSISFAMPGIKRDDPDFYTAYLVNYVLGGGTFSSRLYEEVREKRGLAYGVYSNLGNYDHGGIIGASSATGAANAAKTVEIMKSEIRRIAQDGPTAEELEKAKKFIVGSYAISNLDTSNKIASVLVAIQQANLGIDYIDKRADYIGNVTLEDAKRVAKELFSAPLTQVTVGKKL